MILVDKTVNSTVWLGGQFRIPTTGIEVDPTSASIEIWPVNNTTQTVTGQACSKFDSMLGYYGYAWDVSAVSAGLYQFRITFVYSSANYPVSGYVAVTDGTYSIPTPPTTTAIRDEVWGKGLTDSIGAGTMGSAIADNLDSKVSKAGTGGGDIAVPIKTEDTDGTPLGGTAVYITSDVAGNSRVTATQISDDDGVVTFFLNAGVYYVWMFRTGKTWLNPGQITVTEA